MADTEPDTAKKAKPARSGGRTGAKRSTASEAKPPEAKATGAKATGAKTAGAKRPAGDGKAAAERSPARGRPPAEGAGEGRGAGKPAPARGQGNTAPPKAPAAGPTAPGGGEARVVRAVAPGGQARRGGADLRPHRGPQGAAEGRGGRQARGPFGQARGGRLRHPHRPAPRAPQARDAAVRQGGARDEVRRDEDGRGEDARDETPETPETKMPEPKTAGPAEKKPAAAAAKPERAPDRAPAAAMALSADPAEALGSLTEQGHHIAHNMAEVFDVSGQIWQKWLQAQIQEGGRGSPEQMNAMPTFAELARVMWDNPRQVADMTIDYWAAQQALWQKSMLKWLGAKDESEKIALPHMLKADKRFAHKEWTENALFEYLKENYLLTAGWIQNAVANVGEMDPKERRKAALYTRNYVEALNPANFFALNPEVLEATVNEKGENLVRGLKMMLEDLERGKGKLLIRQTDMDAFEVGRNTAVSPGSVIWQNDILQLIQYAPTTETVAAKPVLFVPPWINKFYVLDLNPKKSMVHWLVNQGYTVFMISWVNPDARHKDKTWESYMRDGASAAIDAVLKETGQESLNLASYCVGGTLAGTLMAHMGRTGDKRVSSATFFTAQLDFEDAGELQCLVDEQMLELIEDEKGKGYFPAEKMAAAFNMLRANDLIWGYVVNNYLLGKDPFPFDLLFWNSDSTSMPAKVHRFYLDAFYLKNRFAREGVDVGGETLKISDIEGPVYHVATKEDHIAPAHSVYRGAKEMKKADVRFVLSGSGHIAGVVNPPALGKYQFWTNMDMGAEALEDWMRKAEETPGSWWPDWDAWLKARSGDPVPARTPATVHAEIEPAPGSYVKVRFDKE
jgi:polyhydroxyalkanoate synthase subunit PhaC